MSLPSALRPALLIGLSLAAFLPLASHAQTQEQETAPLTAPAAGQQQAEIALIDSLQKIAEGNGLPEQTETAQTLKALFLSNEERASGAANRALTDWLLDLAHEMNGDTLPLAQLYVGWPFSRQNPNLRSDLQAAMAQGETLTYLVSLAPQSTEYLRLMQALQIYHAMASLGGWPAVEQGPALKPGMTDPRVRQIRARLQAEAYTLPQCQNTADEAVYDEALKNAVTEYQLRNGLDADGTIGAQTIASLNVPLAERINQLRANMARLRAMPRSWPTRSVIVNIPDATATFYEEGHAPYLTPVVVGRRDRKTPFIASAISSVVLNPTWTVPARIARDDILPKLKKDPHYLEKMGFSVSGADGAPLDWEQIRRSESVFRLRQAPGELNALGPIKFDFNNDFAVYMHGTPHKEAFARAGRALSSGCVRLEEPEQIAQIVLSGTQGGWTYQKVKDEIAKGKSRWVKVENPMPIYFIYQTAFLPDGGAMPHFRRDIYNYDKPLLKALSSPR